MKNFTRTATGVAVAIAGLLAATAGGVAQGEERPAPTPTVIAASPAPIDAARRMTPPLEAVEHESSAPAREAPGVERRCERTGRIGKFHITRCD